MVEICPFCGENSESLSHLFLTCPFARACWYASPLDIRPYSNFVANWIALWISSYYQDLSSMSLINLSKFCHFIFWILCGFSGSRFVLQESKFYLGKLLQEQLQVHPIISGTRRGSPIRSISWAEPSPRSNNATHFN
ncbi:hypothetical protein K1719_038976 [Acacia pycnantha]|nr:hypothetical protein K1719_038976 [Acacia pycnantha]